MPAGLDHVLPRHVGRRPERQPGGLRRVRARASRAAVRRINADKRRYVSYFIRDFPDHPGVQALTPDDFNLGRIQLKEPGPIPEHEARWAWEWMASWGLLVGRASTPRAQINRKVEEEAHKLAAPASPASSTFGARRSPSREEAGA